jgi:enamine deaminase RidA (YjgF/YER057c/UK114 family)/N-acetylglutamate synthase-like GNAT family acetyltransferase
MSMRRVSVSSGVPWETKVGYARLVKLGRSIYVSGTTAFTSTAGNGEIAGVGDAYAQALQCLRNIESALERVGSSLNDVVRTRMFVVDIARDFDAIGRAHAELLGSVKPATSMLQVSALVDPRMLVEIEADAVLGAARAIAEERARIVQAASFAPDSDLAVMLCSVDLPLPNEGDAVTMLKAYLGGELVGCVGYGQYGQSAVLHSLVVNREAKGEGVGRALVQAVIERVQKAGVRRVYLATTDTARYFGYLGFLPVSREAIAVDALSSPELAQYAAGEVTYMCYTMVSGTGTAPVLRGGAS